MIDGHSYTSNTAKLLKHLPMLHGMQQTGKVQPVMIHLAPIGICNLECSYCVYGGRATGEQLSAEQVASCLKSFHDLGTCGLEWTGGGEPTLWKPLRQSMMYAASLCYTQALITNAIKFDWIGDCFDLLQWMRVSFHGFNEGKRGAIEKNIDLARSINPSLTISGVYIWTEGSDEIYPEVAAYAAAAKIPTRVTPDLTAGPQAINEMMSHVRGVVDRHKNEYCFLSDFNVKTHRLHDRCYMSMVKPFVFTDGWVYDCPCIGLSPENAKNIDSKFRVCRIEDIAEHYAKPAAARHHACGFCKFSAQNELIDEIMRPVMHEDFA